MLITLLIYGCYKKIEFPLSISRPNFYAHIYYSQSANTTNGIYDVPSDRILNFMPQNYMANPYSFLKYFRFGTDYKLNFKHNTDKGFPLHILKLVSNSTSTWITYKDAFVCGKGSFSFDLQNLVYFHERGGEYFNQKSGEVVCECDELIQTVSELSRKTYGHIFIDLWGTLFFIPSIIRERSYIIGAESPSYYNEALKLIGFREKQIISIKTDEWIFAKQFHTVAFPRAYVNHYGPMYQWMYDIVNKKLDLDKIKPYRYCLMNRQHMPRVFIQWESFVNYTRNTYPSIKWTEIPDRESNMTSTAKLYASIKLIFCSVGSSCMKCIFMKENTVVLAGITDVVEWGTLTIAMNRKIFLYFWRIPDRSHFSPNPCVIHYNYSDNAIKAGLRALEYNEFPGNRSLGIA